MACIHPSFLHFYLFRPRQHNTSCLLPKVRWYILGLLFLSNPNLLLCPLHLMLHLSLSSFSFSIVNEATLFICLFGQLYFSHLRWAKQDNQLQLTYNSSVLLQDVALKTYQKRWRERVWEICADGATWWWWYFSLINFPVYTTRHIKILHTYSLISHPLFTKYPLQHNGLLPNPRNSWPHSRGPHKMLLWPLTSTSKFTTHSRGTLQNVGLATN